jgi:UDP-N-acetyl-D-galactosamine dehydrogenase
MDARTRIVVIGLGYVGLPLAIALAKKFEVHGVDINAERIAELKQGHDRTGEISSDRLRDSTLRLTSDPAGCPPADFYIVTVPTPVDAANKPDLGIVMAATRTVGAMISADRQPIIVYESTVYPGVTEELCRPLLEEVSGLTCGKDFFLGYSPERINPGDREHTIDKITKVVSGQTPEICDRIGELYGAITSGGVFKAASIKAAEAAKVIENTQRDINVAFMNEIAQIFGLMDLSVWDVLAAANTKWNFLPFTPGLVGGHCISVDPFYLSHRAEQLGYSPRIILGGRSVNDGMAGWIADDIDRKAGGAPGRTLVLGLTFKEDVPDLRNSKVADLIAALRSQGRDVVVHDPHADHAEAEHEYGITLDDAALDGQYDLVVIAVPHDDYRKRGLGEVAGLVAPGGMLADLKNCFPEARRDAPVATWTL